MTGGPGAKSPGPSTAGPVACTVIAGRLRVHVAPKCGSDSITRAMQGLPGFRRDRVDDPGEEYRFGVVRHPLERLVSGWAYFCRDGRLNNQQRMQQLGYRHGMWFSEFLDVALANHWRNQHTRAQVDFIGTKPFDRLVRTENLDGEWEALRALFPELRPIGRHNRSSHDADWPEFYDADRWRRAATIYAADMDLYERAES